MNSISKIAAAGILFVFAVFCVSFPATNTKPAPIKVNYIKMDKNKVQGKDLSKQRAKRSFKNSSNSNIINIITNGKGK